LLDAISVLWAVWQKPVNIGRVYAELLIKYFNLDAVAKALSRDHRAVFSLALYYLWLSKEADIFSSFTAQQKIVFNLAFIEKVLGNEFDFYYESFRTHYIGLGVLIDKYDDIKK
jgi:hypothetical protein